MLVGLIHLKIIFKKNQCKSNNKDKNNCVSTSTIETQFLIKDFQRRSACTTKITLFDGGELQSHYMLCKQIQGSLSLSIKYICITAYCINMYNILSGNQLICIEEISVRFERASSSERFLAVSQSSNDPYNCSFNFPYNLHLG